MQETKQKIESLEKRQVEFESRFKRQPLSFFRHSAKTITTLQPDFIFYSGHLLFAMPNQVFVPPLKTDNLKYFKLLFDDNTLVLLPQQFPFLANP